MAISKNELISKFSESTGVEKARELVELSAQQAGYANKAEYSKEEVIAMMGFLKDQGSMVKILANFLIAEMQMSG